MARNNTIFQESLRRAHNFAWDRQWPQAIADLLERLKREAEAAQENVMLARLLYERGRAPEALERARHALELDSRNGEARALITGLQSEAPLANQPVAPAPLPVVTDYES